MNLTNAILAENPDFKIVIVCFDAHPKQYHYKTFFDVKIDDKVVVDSPTNGLTVVTVTDVLSPMEFEGTYSLKWLVSGAIDLTYYDELKKMERTVLKTVNQMRFESQRAELLTGLQDQIGQDGVNKVKGLVRL